MKLATCPRCGGGHIAEPLNEDNERPRCLLCNDAHQVRGDVAFQYCAGFARGDDDDQLEKLARYLYAKYIMVHDLTPAPF